MLTQFANIPVGSGKPLVVIAGPCVIESAEGAMSIARRLKSILSEVGLPLIFKASFDKANRNALASFRGPGLDEGLEVLAGIRDETGLPVLSDVHETAQVAQAAKVLDVLQIPAFLCRQTDLVVAAATSGKPVNIKKGQFMAPEDMEAIVGKARTSNPEVQLALTERGSTFGYHNLVVDMRAIETMRRLAPVVFDATHSVQLPGAGGGKSGGQSRFVPVLSRAAVAAGADAVFLEVHDDPSKALCDGPNMVALSDLAELLGGLKALRETVLTVVE
ncbi:MAG: 3-deoxy-8-phosphooctulonate synthase [Planctomycetota bacterium]